MMDNQRKALTALVIVLFAGSVAGNIYQALQLRQQSETLSDRNTEIASLSEDLEDRRDEIEELEERLGEVEAELEEATGGLVEANEEISELEDENRDYRSEVRELENDLAQLKCPVLDPGQFDYVSNTSMHRALRDFSDRYGQPVGGGSWELVWNNRDAAFHDIRVRDRGDNQTYAWKYVVFFDEGRFSESVFDVNYQCWLDR